ncbi:MAG: hypothetical protein DRR11_20575 [Gammaproteobacteria bacterium]|nr:MAG: hypothetical protein DRR11_20575 [Gammaproteobacteria bacterium]
MATTGVHVSVAVRGLIQVQAVCVTGTIRQVASHKLATAPACAITAAWNWACANEIAATPILLLPVTIDRRASQRQRVIAVTGAIAERRHNGIRLIFSFVSAGVMTQCVPQPHVPCLLPTTPEVANRPRSLRGA